MQSTVRAVLAAVALIFPANLAAAQGTDNVQVIQMSAKKYEFTPAEIRVKKGTRVQIQLRPTDREHGLKIKARPEGAGKDAPAGLRFIGADEIKVKQNEQGVLEFVAERAGTYEFECAKFCGFGHGRMKGKLIVED